MSTKNFSHRGKFRRQRKQLWCGPAGTAHFVASVIGADVVDQPILVAGANFPSNSASITMRNLT